jgi:uncharacterized membrane protein
VTDFTLTDALALALFIACWVGFGRFSVWKAKRDASLMGTLRLYRIAWMERMSQRDAHQADAAILNNIIRNVHFFAQTTVFILAGLVALLGTTDKVVELVARLPFRGAFVVWVWEVKIVMMIYIFVYAFFKFTWCAWQYNASSVVIGGMPDPHSHSEAIARYANTVSQLTVLAGQSFNHGMRAYYYSMAALSWFLHPLIFIACTTWVTIVLYRREFHSDTLDALLVGVERKP